MNTVKNLASRIKILREIHNFTQEYVANTLGISQNTYSLLEKGETKLTIERLEHLANLYNLDLIDLIRNSNQTFVHSISNSSGFFSDHVTINQMAEGEREIYLKTIQRMEDEIIKLHSLIEKLTNKI